MCFSALQTVKMENQKQPPHKCSIKNLKILQYSREIFIVGVSFLWSCRPYTWNFIKKRPQHRYFPVNIAKFLRTYIFKNMYFEEHLRMANSEKQNNLPNKKALKSVWSNSVSRKNFEGNNFSLRTYFCRFI